MTWAPLTPGEGPGPSGARATAVAGCAGVALLSGAVIFLIPLLPCYCFVSQYSLFTEHPACARPCKEMHATATGLQERAGGRRGPVETVSPAGVHRGIRCHGERTQKRQSCLIWPEKAGGGPET